MQRTTLLILLLMLQLVCAACARDGKAPTGAANTSTNTANATAAANQNTSATGMKTPPTDIVSADAKDVEIRAGSEGVASVRVRIAEGYHIGANPATLSYQIPTQITVEPSDGVSAGQPVYPPSEMKKFSFEPEPFAVYEGEVVIKIPLRVEANAVQGARPIRARLRVQACDDQACYPPRTINTSIPIRVN